MSNTDRLAACARLVAPLLVLASLAPGCTVETTTSGPDPNSGSSSSSSGGGGSSSGGAGGAMAGTFYYTFGGQLFALDVASGVESNLALPDRSQDLLGVGGGILTDVEEIDGGQAIINVRHYAGNVFSLVGTIGPLDVSAADVWGAARPSTDGSLFLVPTREQADAGAPVVWYMRVIDRSGTTVARVEGHTPIWVSADRAVVTGDDGLFVMTVGAKGVSAPQRIGNVGLGSPGYAPQVPGVSIDGSTLTFLQADMVWRIGIDGSNLTQVTAQRTSQSWPIFSPDGSMVIVQYGDCRLTAAATVEVIAPANPAGAPLDPIASTAKISRLRPDLSATKRFPVPGCGPVAWLP